MYSVYILCLFHIFLFKHCLKYNTVVSQNTFMCIYFFISNLIKNIFIKIYSALINVGSY